jgi:rhamnosyl/mannosyltransferase
LNVLHVFRTFLTDSFGGTEQVIGQLIRGNQSSDVRLRVASLSRNPGPAVSDYFGAEIIRFRENCSIASNSFSWPLMREFGGLIAKADIVHYHFPWPYADLLHLLWRVRKPSVVTYYSDIVRQRMLLQFYSPLMYKFLRSVDAIVAISPNYLATSPVLRHYADKTTVIPIGLDKDSYPRPGPECLQGWRGRFGDRFFLFVGMLRYYKGLHILLEAMRGVDFPVVIVGAGPIEEQLREHAAKLGLRNIHFLGALPEEDKVALLELCLAVVFPSHLRSEVFGISLLEGAMYGKAMISSEIGTGTSYVNIDSETGLVVPPSDPEALRKAMQYLLEHPDVAAEMGRAGERRYKAMFTAERMAASYETLYRKLLESRARPVRNQDGLLLPGAAANHPTGSAIGVKRVMVSGATSQVGRFLLPKLTAAGTAVYALSRREGGAGLDSAKESAVHWLRADLVQPDMAETLPPAYALIHIASIQLLPALLPGMAAIGVRRVIAFSSTSRFGKARSADPEEIEFVARLAQAEEDVERVCNERGIDWTIFRPTLIYGACMDSNVMTIAKLIRKFGVFPLLGEAQGERQPVHADDLAEACVLALEASATFGKVYNLSGGEILTYREMVERIFAALGKKPRFVRVPFVAFRLAMALVSLVPRYRDFNTEMARRMNDDLVFDHAEATRDFGYAPRSFQPWFPDEGGS